jgi:hypothetical protein
MLKNPAQKRAGGVAQGGGPEFKPQYQKKKKKGWKRWEMFVLQFCCSVNMVLSTT